jgi:hypothetical protein
MVGLSHSINQGERSMGQYQYTDADDTTDLEHELKAYDAVQRRQRKLSVRQPGDVFLRILPPKLPPGQKGLFYREYGSHYEFRKLVGSTTAPHSVLCLQRTLDQECPACLMNEQIATILPNGQINDLEEKRQSATTSRVRFAMNVIEMTPAGKPKDGGAVKVWDVGWEILKQLRALMQDWKDLTSPSTGTVLRVTYETAFRFTAPKSVAITRYTGPLEVDGWREARVDFDDYLSDQIDTARRAFDQYIYKRTATPAADMPRAAAAPADSSDMVGDDEDTDASAAPVRSASSVPAGTLNLTDPQVQSALKTLGKDATLESLLETLRQSAARA